MEAAYPADLTPDVTAAVTHIMLERELKRTPQRSLFGAPAEDSSEEEVSKVQRPVVTGAELQMLHRFDRPFYFGFERLADAANENIEQFVTLAAEGEEAQAETEREILEVERPDIAALARRGAA